MRFLTDEQVARMRQNLLMVERTIHYCSAVATGSDYKLLEGVTVHRRELQNVPYRDCGLGFEVLYHGTFRRANKADFTIDEQ